jgi:hypothetical protein
MLCPVCGYFSADQSVECLQCGHRLNAVSGEPVSKPPLKIFTPGILRAIIYLGSVYAVFQFFYIEYKLLIQARTEQSEAGLKQQILEHRKQLTLAADYNNLKN